MDETPDADWKTRKDVLGLAKSTRRMVLGALLVFLYFGLLGYGGSILNESTKIGQLYVCEEYLVRAFSQGRGWRAAYVKFEKSAFQKLRDRSIIPLAVSLKGAEAYDHVLVIDRSVYESAEFEQLRSYMLHPPEAFAAFPERDISNARFAYKVARHMSRAGEKIALHVEVADITWNEQKKAPVSGQALHTFTLEIALE